MACHASPPLSATSSNATYGNMLHATWHDMPRVMCHKCLRSTGSPNWALAQLRLLALPLLPLPHSPFLSSLDRRRRTLSESCTRPMTMINYLLGARCHMDVNVSAAVSASVSVSLSNCMCIGVSCAHFTYARFKATAARERERGRGATSSWTWKSLMKLLFCITNGKWK